VSDRAERIAWFKQTILPHEASLRRHLRRLAVGQDLDDLVSECLARAYATADWSPIGYGKSYLFTIARNLLVDAARRRRIVSFDLYADMERLGQVDDQPDPEAQVTARQELKRLQEVVDTLPEQARRVFLMRRVQELSLKAIADSLDLSVSTVEKHLAKAMDLVARAMADGDPVTRENQRPSWRAATKNN
jgi:RNA polymerase sigma factor (sigma-70 family)